MKGSERKKIVIAAANGFIGRHLTWMLSREYHVIALVRHDVSIEGASEYVMWDGKSLGNWVRALEGAYAVINLSGKSVDCRHTEKNKKAILNSRVDSTRIIGEAISKCAEPPRVWLNSSGVSLYPESFTNPTDETTTERADDFLAEVSEKWEEALFSDDSEVRKVAMRTTIVFGTDGGTYPTLRKLTKFFLGGKQGSGQQMFSWIHIDDFCRIVEQLLLENSEVSGPVNMVAPEIVTNKELMYELRKQLRVPFGIPSPAFILKIGGFIIGTEASLVLKSSCVSSKVLKENDFQFRYPTLSEAIENLEQSKKS